MEIESLFGGTRWEMIQLLSKGPMSPNELASSLGTSAANVSQQLRLVELGSIVKSERARMAGKARVEYTIASDVAYLIFASNGHAEKKMLEEDLYHTYMVRSFLADRRFHERLGKAYWKIAPHADLIAAVGFDAQKQELIILGSGLPRIEGDKDLSIVIAEESKKKVFPLFDPEGRFRR